LLVSRAAYRAVERRFNPVGIGSLETVKKILLTLLLTLLQRFGLLMLSFLLILLLTLLLTLL
jgi:hypothetical protein